MSCPERRAFGPIDDAAALAPERLEQVLAHLERCPACRHEEGVAAEAVDARVRAGVDLAIERAGAARRAPVGTMTAVAAVTAAASIAAAVVLWPAPPPGEPPGPAAPSPVAEAPAAGLFGPPTDLAAVARERALPEPVDRIVAIARATSVERLRVRTVRDAGGAPSAAVIADRDDAAEQIERLAMAAAERGTFMRISFERATGRLDYMLH